MFLAFPVLTGAGVASTAAGGQQGTVPWLKGQNAGKGGLSSPLLLCLLPPFVTAVNLSGGDGAPSSLLLLDLTNLKDIWLSLPLLLWLLPGPNIST